MLRKRISIRVEHTEVTLSIAEVPTHNGPSAKAGMGASPPPERCPVCGATWLPDLREVLGAIRLTATQLKEAAAQGRLHLFCSADNRVWVCERSIQELRAEFLSSTISKSRARRSDDVR